MFYKILVCLLISLQAKLLLPLTNHSVRIDTYELPLVCNSDQSLCLEQSCIVCKKLQRVQPEPFLRSFQIFYLFYHRPKFYFNWPTILTKFTHMNRNVSLKLTESVMKYLFLKHFGIVCKKFQSVHPEPLYTLDKLLPLLIANPSV